MARSSVNHRGSVGNGCPQSERVCPRLEDAGLARHRPPTRRHIHRRRFGAERRIAPTDQLQEVGVQVEVANGHEIDENHRHPLLAAQRATKIRRCSGRSLFEGLMISTAATRRRHRVRHRRYAPRIRRDSPDRLLPSGLGGLKQRATPPFPLLSRAGNGFGPSSSKVPMSTSISRPRWTCGEASYPGGSLSSKPRTIITGPWPWSPSQDLRLESGGRK